MFLTLKRLQEENAAEVYVPLIDDPNYDLENIITILVKVISLKNLKDEFYN